MGLGCFLADCGPEYDEKRSNRMFVSGVVGVWTRNPYEKTELNFYISAKMNKQKRLC